MSRRELSQGSAARDVLQPAYETPASIRALPSGIRLIDERMLGSRFPVISFGVALTALISYCLQQVMVSFLIWMHRRGLTGLFRT